MYSKCYTSQSTDNAFFMLNCGCGVHEIHYRVLLFFVRLMIIVIIVITLLRWIQHLDKYGCMTETRAAIVEVHIR